MKLPSETTPESPQQPHSQQRLSLLGPKPPDGPCSTPAHPTFTARPGFLTASLGRVSVSIKHFIQGSETAGARSALNKGIPGLLSSHSPSLPKSRSSSRVLTASPSVPHLAGATRPPALCYVKNWQFMATYLPDETTQSATCILTCTRCIPQHNVFIQLKGFHDHSLINEVSNPNLQIYSHCLFSSVITEPTGHIHTLNLIVPNYLTRWGLKNACSGCSLGSAFKASSSNCVMTSRAGL